MLLYLLAFALFSFALYNLLFHPLAGIPGPLGSRTGLWSWKSTRAVKRDMGWKLLELHKKYGTVVRIARNEVSVCERAPKTHLTRPRFKKPLKKTEFYDALRDLDGPNLLSTLDNKSHTEMRRAESAAYSLTKMQSEFEGSVQAACGEFLALLDRRIAAMEGKATLDLGEAIQFFAMDVVGRMVLGKSFGLCAGEDRRGWVPLVERILEMSCFLGTQPFLLPFVRWASRSQGADMMCEADRCSNRFNSDPFREMFMQAKNADGSVFSRDQVRAAVYVSSFFEELIRNLTLGRGLTLGTGSDLILSSPQKTMRAMIRYIVGNVRFPPVIYDKVQAEIESALVVFPLSYEDACKLVYFQACLKETLRLHPPIPWPLPRTVAAGGLLLSGNHFLAEGTQVSMSPFVVHRQIEAFGSDAGEFRPERWLEADETHLLEMERKLLAFGAGPRVCIGKNIGLMEVFVVVPVLLWRYRIGFTTRSSEGPHRYRLGRDVDGKVGNDVPYFVTSQWAAVQRDFWCDLASRV
ncbi:cytochrome P450 oxidoreductase [Roridomyces roridus]|uniref:Cytochrome P450 oxidoreductase n=1 Tax=Roridomyces roridus TaxID=1738132 RepID=A0AAD7B0U5_9AGAR|nr:cytochrome P450 oxidoreductase [Roridomyces roridus]